MYGSRTIKQDTFRDGQEWREYDNFRWKSQTLSYLEEVVMR